VSIRAKRFKNRTVGGVIGSMTLFRLRQDTRFSPYPWADAEAYDEALFNLVLGIYDLGNGGYRQAFCDTVVSCDGDLLVLSHVRLDEAWRGFGLGPILASQAIWALADGCSAVAVEATASETPKNQHPLSQTEWTEANGKITALWEGIGFRRRTNPLGHLLDPKTEEARDARNHQRKRFDALARAYRTAPAA
jgi:GNAT superfamily N-acetyltransferase